MFFLLPTVSALFGMFLLTGYTGEVNYRDNANTVHTENIRLDDNLGFGSLPLEYTTGDSQLEVFFDNDYYESFDSYSSMSSSYRQLWFETSTDNFVNNVQSYPSPFIEFSYSTNLNGNGPGFDFYSWVPMNYAVEIEYEVFVDNQYKSVSASFNNLTCWLTSRNTTAYNDTRFTMEDRYANSTYYLPNVEDSILATNVSTFSFRLTFTMFYSDWNVADVLENGGTNYNYWSGYQTAMREDIGVGNYPDYESGFDAGYTIGFNDAKQSDEDTIYSIAYNNGYGYGVQDGYSNGYTDGANSVDTESYYLDGVNTGYWNGYAVGYSEGSTAPTYTFGELFGSIADTPVLIVRGLFDFDFFGINLMTVVLSMFTALIALFIVRKLL